MRCPVDDTQLAMSERSGIEIDYCPECRGVWLDRGELDKLIDRADRDQSAPDPRRSETSRSPKKKKNFLGEIFELGG